MPFSGRHALHHGQKCCIPHPPPPWAYGNVKAVKGSILNKTSFCLVTIAYYFCFTLELIVCCMGVTYSGNHTRKMCCFGCEVILDQVTQTTVSIRSCCICKVKTISGQYWNIIGKRQDIAWNREVYSVSFCSINTGDVI